MKRTELRLARMGSEERQNILQGKVTSWLGAAQDSSSSQNTEDHLDRERAVGSSAEDPVTDRGIGLGDKPHNDMKEDVLRRVDSVVDRNRDAVGRTL